MPLATDRGDDRMKKRYKRKKMKSEKAKVKTKAKALVICVVFLMAMSGGVVSADVSSVIYDANGNKPAIEIKNIKSATSMTPYKILVIDTGFPENYQALDILGYTYTLVTPSEFMSVDLSQYDVLYVGWIPDPSPTGALDALVSRKNDIIDFLHSGGGVIALAEFDDPLSYKWLPFDVSTPGLDYGDLVTIQMPKHPLMNNLTDALLSGWRSSVHTYFTWISEPVDVIATESYTGGNHPCIIAKEYGTGKIAVTGMDPDWHIVYGGGGDGPEILLANMLDWAAEGAAGPTVSIYTDETSYTTGDTMRVGLDVSNPGDAMPVIFAIWLEMPEGGIYVLTFTSVTLPAGLDYSNPNFAVFTLPSIPSGTYMWHAALIEPSRPVEVISHDTAEWEFVSAVAGAPTEDVSGMLEQTAVVIDFGE